jgi:polyisoprenoid-binding protein YceI
MSAPTRPGVLQPGRWAVTPTSSRAGFTARDVLRKPVVGTLDITSAYVEVDEHGIPVAVSAELDLASVDTGNDRRDTDLRGRRFFDVSGSPQLLFTGGPGVHRGDGWSVPGLLTLRGVSCPVQLAVTVRERADGGRSVRAEAVLDRRDLGITVPRLLVGATVQVTVEAELLPPTTHA